MKRNNKEIENSVKFIQEAAKKAKTVEDISKVTGLTAGQIRSALKRHPIISRRVRASLNANRTSKTTRTRSNRSEKAVVICDVPALMHGFRSCIATPVVVPQFVQHSLEAICQCNNEDGGRALKALTYMGALTDWCTIAPRVPDLTLIAEPEEEVSWRSRLLVRTALQYHKSGYKVTVKTRTSEIARLAKAQGCLNVDFVPTDDKVF